MKTLEKILRASYKLHICSYYGPRLLSRLASRSLETLRKLSYRISREKYLAELKIPERTSESYSELAPDLEYHGEKERIGEP